MRSSLRRNLEIKTIKRLDLDSLEEIKDFVIKPMNRWYKHILPNEAKLVYSISPKDLFNKLGQMAAYESSMPELGYLSDQMFKELEQLHTLYQKWFAREAMNTAVIHKQAMKGYFFKPSTDVAMLERFRSKGYVRLGNSLCKLPKTIKSL